MNRGIGLLKEATEITVKLGDYLYFFKKCIIRKKCHLRAQV